MFTQSAPHATSGGMQSTAVVAVPVVVVEVVEDDVVAVPVVEGADVALVSVEPVAPRFGENGGRQAAQARAPTAHGDRERGMNTMTSGG